ncbi:MAG: hypothetical protein HYY06_22675 [Deltaproteobacteria bacterium]|nr:hypothetical protein [Deltaproteobacteria bacterium]
MKRLWVGIVVALLGSGCACGDDDDTGPLGDGDADADSDTTPPEVSAEPELPESVRQGGLLETTLVATDPDDETFAWTVISPEGATVDQETGTLDYRVPVDTSGDIVVSVDVSDGTNTTRFEDSVSVVPLAWEELSPAWDAQYFTATAFDSGRRTIWSVGGFGQTRAAVVMKNDLAVGAWERVATTGDPLPPLFGAGACFLASEDLVVVVGGFPGHLSRVVPRNRAVFVLDVARDPVQVTQLEGDEPPEALFPRLACSPDEARAFLVGTFDLEGITMTPWVLDLTGNPRLAVTALEPKVTPDPRAYFGMVVLGSVAWIFGGDENPGEPATNYNDVWSLPLDDSGDWQELVTTGEAPSPRANVAVGSDGQKLFVAGGYRPGTGPDAELRFLDLETGQWSDSEIGGEDVEAFFTQTSVFDAQTSTLHLLTPTFSTEENGLYTDRRDAALEVDLEGSTAELVLSEPAPGQGPRRRFSTLVATGGNLSRLAIHGGSTAVMSAGDAVDDTWTFDVDSGEWSAVAPEGETPGPRQAAVFVEDDGGRVLAIGGWDGQDLSDMEVRAFDPDNGDWRLIESRGEQPTPRIAPCAAFNPDAGTVLLFGGVTQSERSADVFELAPGSSVGQWRLIDAGEGPAGRAFAGCGYDSPSRRFFVVGGEDRAAVFDDVWALDLSDPGNERWLAIQPEGEGPGVVSDMVAVVDPPGRKLVLVGGTNGRETYGEVWFLDLRPGAEAWSRLPWDPWGPEARSAAGGAWHAPSGSLLVFGGRLIDPGVAAFNDLWRLAL